jgi:hypothetical protein
MSVQQCCVIGECCFQGMFIVLHLDCAACTIAQSSSMLPVQRQQILHHRLPVSVKHICARRGRAVPLTMAWLTVCVHDGCPACQHAASTAMLWRLSSKMVI